MTEFNLVLRGPNASSPEEILRALPEDRLFGAKAARAMEGGRPTERYGGAKEYAVYTGNAPSVPARWRCDYSRSEDVLRDAFLYSVFDHYLHEVGDTATVETCLDRIEANWDAGDRAGVERGLEELEAVAEAPPEDGRIDIPAGASAQTIRRRERFLALVRADEPHLQRMPPEADGQGWQDRMRDMIASCCEQLARMVHAILSHMTTDVPVPLFDGGFEFHPG